MITNFVLCQLGTNPLHLASIYGHTSTAEVLIKSGISRDARTKVSMLLSNVSKVLCNKSYKHFDNFYLFTQQSSNSKL